MRPGESGRGLLHPDAIRLLERLKAAAGTGSTHLASRLADSAGLSRRYGHLLICQLASAGLLAIDEAGPCVTLTPAGSTLIAAGGVATEVR
jgi:hypothetical protein